MRARCPLAVRAAVAPLVTTLLLACPSPKKDPELTIAAATSLREVVPELARGYEASHPGQHVTATYGASGDLARQVAAGAPVDVVLFAAARPVEDLAAAGYVERGSERGVASNEMVLVGPRGARPLTFATLTTLPPGEKLAVGDPRTVPAGEYARDYLTSLGEWGALEGRLVLGANVGAVLVYARRGEAAAAIVYRTELRGASDLVVLDEAKGAAAPHPQVVGGVVHGGHAGATALLAFIASPAGASVLAAYGFGPP